MMREIEERPPSLTHPFVLKETGGCLYCDCSAERHALQLSEMNDAELEELLREYAARGVFGSLDRAKAISARIRRRRFVRRLALLLIIAVIVCITLSALK